MSKWNKNLTKSRRGIQYIHSVNTNFGSFWYIFWINYGYFCEENLSSYKFGEFKHKTWRKFNRKISHRPSFTVISVFSRYYYYYTEIPILTIYLFSIFPEH